MSFGKESVHRDQNREPLSGLIERVTFHSQELAFQTASLSDDALCSNHMDLPLRA